MRNTRNVAALAVVAAVTLLGWSATPARAEQGDCGQPQSTGATPKTGDALAALRTAVGSVSACDERPCICDVTGDGKTQTSDALRILRNAVGQKVSFACACPCTELGGSAALADSRGISIAPRQVEIGATIIAINKESFSDLGLDFDLSTSVVTDLGPAAGGTSDHENTIAVDSSASGGPEDVQYLVPEHITDDDALPILNKNFISPFEAVKTVVGLPTKGCVLFDPQTFSVPQNHPGSDPLDNVDPEDAGFGGAQVYYEMFQDMGAAAFLASIQGDNRNKVLSAPVVHVYDRQSFFHMVDDVQPTINDMKPGFKSRIQDVTPSPFGIFTGPVLDVRPTIDGDSIHMELRLGSEMATFFFSTAFLVDGVQTDAEIPIHMRSRNRVNVEVQDGHTLVLGAMLRSGMQNADKGLPLLGRIPVVGSLFDHDHFDPDEQNLIIMITPTILDE